MGFNIIKGNEIQQSGLTVMIYGDPGVGKTSLALSAKNAVLFDFDEGAHRSEFSAKNSIVRIRNWKEMDQDLANIDQILADFDTVVIDTVETCLDFIRTFVEDMDYKLKRNKLQMFGALKDTFHSFLKRLHQLNKTVILIAHTSTEEQNGIQRTIAKITGGSKDIVWQKADFVGFYYLENNQRTLNFNGTDYYSAKNSAGFEPLRIPNLHAEPDYFAKKIDQMLDSINSRAKKQADTIEILDEWRSKLDQATMPADFTDLVMEIGKQGFQNGVQNQLKVLIKNSMNKHGFKFNKDKRLYEPDPEKQPAKAPEPQQEPVIDDDIPFGNNDDGVNYV
jgi:phage nucleotide-binding protein